MNDVFRALLVVHIIAGTIALVVAPGAMLTFKGGLWHRRWGKIFFWATIVIAATGAVMSLLRPNLFLLMVAVFSFYLVFSGYRVLQRKKPGQRATSLDQAVTLAMILAGVAFIAYGVQRLQISSFGIVPIVFGAVALFLAGSDMVQFRHPAADAALVVVFAHEKYAGGIYRDGLRLLGGQFDLPAADRALALADRHRDSRDRSVDAILSEKIRTAGRAHCVGELLKRRRALNEKGHSAEWPS